MAARARHSVTSALEWAKIEYLQERTRLCRAKRESLEQAMRGRVRYPAKTTKLGVEGNGRVDNGAPVVQVNGMSPMSLRLTGQDAPSRSVQDALKDWHAHMLAEQEDGSHAEQCVAAARRCCAHNEWNDPREVNDGGVVAWLDHETTVKKWGGRTRNDKCSKIKKWAAFCEFRAWIDAPMLARIQRIKRVRNKKARGRTALSDEQIWDLIRITGEQNGKLPRERARLYFFAYCTGVRPNESRRLRVRHIDFARRELDVDESVSKTAEGVRRIPLLPELCEVLREQIAGKGMNDALWPVFPNYITWRDDFNRAGIPETDERGRPTGYYGIRKGLATAWIAKGMDLGQIVAILGHSSSETSFKHYIQPSAAQLAQGIGLTAKRANLVKISGELADIGVDSPTPSGNLSPSPMVANPRQHESARVGCPNPGDSLVTLCGLQGGGQPSPADSRCDVGQSGNSPTFSNNSAAGESGFSVGGLLIGSDGSNLAQTASERWPSRGGDEPSRGVGCAAPFEPLQIGPGAGSTPPVGHASPRQPERKTGASDFGLVATGPAGLMGVTAEANTARARTEGHNQESAGGPQTDRRISESPHAPHPLVAGDAVSVGAAGAGHPGCGGDVQGRAFGGLNGQADSNVLPASNGAGADRAIAGPGQVGSGEVPGAAPAIPDRGERSLVGRRSEQDAGARAEAADAIRRLDLLDRINENHRKYLAIAAALLGGGTALVAWLCASRLPDPKPVQVAVQPQATTADWRSI